MWKFSSFGGRRRFAPSWWEILHEGQISFSMTRAGHGVPGAYTQVSITHQVGLLHRKQETVAVQEAYVQGRLGFKNTWTRLFTRFPCCVYLTPVSRLFSAPTQSFALPETSVNMLGSSVGSVFYRSALEKVRILTKWKKKKVDRLPCWCWLDALDSFSFSEYLKYFILHRSFPYLHLCFSILNFLPIFASKVFLQNLFEIFPSKNHLKFFPNFSELSPSYLSMLTRSIFSLSTLFEAFRNELSRTCPVHLGPSSVYLNSPELSIFPLFFIFLPLPLPLALKLLWIRRL